MLKSKVHRAIVTDTKIDYPGSIAIDSDLMKAADILPYESVMVADVTNGTRLETYAVPSQAGSGRVEILGAAARLVRPKDVIIIFSFVYCTPDEAKKLTPKVVAVDEKNRIKENGSQ